MARKRIGAGLFASRQAIVDVPPMVRRGVGGIDAGGFHHVDRLQNLIDLRPAVDPQQNVAARTDEWQCLVGFSRRNCAYDVDGEMIVPKSFDAQRTKTKTPPGAKLTIRRRRSRTFSSAIRPKRIQCSMRFSSQVSSTCVSAVAASFDGLRLLR